MLTYVSRFWSGGFEPFWPHVILLTLSVLASIAVGAGILFERPKYSEAVHRVAFWLVVGGIVVEAACTIFLFVFDEGISTSQQGKIIALEARLAPRKIENADAFITLLKRYPGTPFDMSVDPAPEPQRLMMQISSMLEAAGWKWVEHPSSGGIVVLTAGKPASKILTNFTGLGVEIDVSKANDWRDAALILLTALKTSVPDTIGNIATDSSVTPNAIHIYVGAKE